jgi:phospholipase A1
MRGRGRLARTVAAGLCAAAGAAAAQPADPALRECAAIGAPADRLACYDKLAGRAPAPAAAPESGPPPATTRLEPRDAPRPGSAEPQPVSLLSRYWELDAADQRGVFNFVGYRINYVLPLHVTNHINRSPSSPTQQVVQLPNYRNVEAKFQLSLRTKVLQDVGLPDGDLWLGFTQQVLWQIWNGTDSKPFRNSDYEPEAIYVVPTAENWRALPFGWQWRYTLLALAHQSNGQSDPLSRSWNRVYLGGGVERGDWSFVARVAHRLGEDPENDNNPDLVSWRGRADLQLNWTSGLQTTSLQWRTSLRKVARGSLQFEWTYPVFRDQPNGLRWYVQGFTGYAETLTDYNFRQTSVGAGVSFLQF